MKKLHQCLGLFMLLPFIAWAVTGVFFFFKPGYKEAYQPLVIKQFPLTELIALPNEAKWLEVRQLETVLGRHLLVRESEGWQQLSFSNLSTVIEPTEQQIRLLVNDAISNNSTRYGDISSINGLEVLTDTGVKITVNWQNMTLRQYGKDTDLINTIYDIHYLRWTGYKIIDQYLGVLGLLLVVLLAIIGTVMAFRKKS